MKRHNPALDNASKAVDDLNASVWQDAHAAVEYVYLSARSAVQSEISTSWPEQTNPSTRSRPDK